MHQSIETLVPRPLGLNRDLTRLKPGFNALLTVRWLQGAVDCKPGSWCGHLTARAITGRGANNRDLTGRTIKTEFSSSRMTSETDFARKLIPIQQTELLASTWNSHGHR